MSKCESRVDEEETVIKYAKKKNISSWRDDSTRSSSSKETAASTPPTDVLELGRFLVKEYLDGRNNDTLSRWLLHSIAERIAKIEQSKKSADAPRLQNEASELILKFWSHRAVGPRGVNPLAKYDPVLKAFRSLLPGASPWESREADRKDRVAAELYQSLTMLTLSLLLVGLEPSEKRSAEERALHNKFLPVNEAAVLLQFEQIENLFSLSERSAKPKVDNGESGSEVVDIADAVRNWAKRTADLSQEVLTMFKNASIPRRHMDGEEGVRRNRKSATRNAPQEKSNRAKSQPLDRKTAKKIPAKRTTKTSAEAKPKSK